jgi:hypothetical protein
MVGKKEIAKGPRGVSRLAERPRDAVEAAFVRALRGLGGDEVVGEPVEAVRESGKDAQSDEMAGGVFAQQHKDAVEGDKEPEAETEGRTVAEALGQQGGLDEAMIGRF